MVVTGAYGFIGSHLVERLLGAGANVKVAGFAPADGARNNLQAVERDIEFQAADLADPQACGKVCRGADVVMHLAAKIRGVGYNVKHHGEMFFSNALMNLHMMEAARLAFIDRFLCVSTVGVYPKEWKCRRPRRTASKENRRPAGLGTAGRSGSLRCRRAATRTNME